MTVLRQPQPSEPRTDGAAVIVVGVDGSAAGNAALRWAVREATRLHGSVRAVSVRYAPELMPATSLAALPHGLTGPEPDPVRQTQWLTELIEAARADVPRAAPVTGIPLVGDPARELARSAEDAELLVVGSHGHGPLAEAFLGSVAAGVLRHARCPVAVIAPHVVDRMNGKAGKPCDTA
jgi:nucleotide-binding universal stress UspA family protein